MSRHYSSRSYGGYGSSRRRTGADRFGIFTFFLLLISSGFLAARLLTTGVLTQKLTLLLLSVLAGLNVLFAVTQLPRWRNKLWKLVLGLVALVLSAGMIYATVATNAVLETLSRVSSTGSVKTVVVRVRENDSAQEIGDTFGYTYGWCDPRCRLAHSGASGGGTGAGQDQVLRHSHGSGRRSVQPGSRRRHPGQRHGLHPEADRRLQGFYVPHP